MNKIWIVIFITITFFSCSNKCDPECNEWEECHRYQGSDAIGFGYRYSCEPILRNYEGIYIGNELHTYVNGQTFNRTRTISTEIYPSFSNYMKFNIDSNSNKFLFAVFSSPGSSIFNIYRQSVSDSIIHPITNNLIYTEIFYEGVGIILGNNLIIDCSYDYLDQSGTLNFSGSF